MDFETKVYLDAREFCCKRFEDKVKESIIEFSFGETFMVGYPDGEHQSGDEDGWERDCATFFIEYCPFCGDKVNLTKEEYKRAYQIAVAKEEK